MKAATPRASATDIRDRGRTQAWMETRKMYLDHAASVQVPTHKYYDLGPGLEGTGMFQKGFYSSVSHTSLDSSTDAA